MASAIFLYCSVMFLALATVIFSLYVSPAHATTSHRRFLNHHHHHIRSGAVRTGLMRVELRHVDDGRNLTKFERLQRGVMRGKIRAERMTTAATDVTSTVHTGNGEFLMDLAIGTPPEKFSAIVDTGSDLIWTQCQPCKDCFKQPTLVFDPKDSSSFSELSCSSNLCKSLPTANCDDDSGCEYLYSYGDYSSTQGVLATETFTFGRTSVSEIGFGCGIDNEGDGFSQGSGLVGLGRGPLSLISQLKIPKFSYCLTSISDEDNNNNSSGGAGTSLLLLGSTATGSNKQITVKTPLVKNPSQPSFYYITLEGISVGGTQLPIDGSTFALNDDGTGGMIIDSGTTITYLEQSAFDLLKKEFVSQVDLEVDDSGKSGLDLCFKLPSSSDTHSFEVPKLVFHLDGAADLDLPADNYMIVDSGEGLACLAMGGSSGMSIFGNVQQQNMLVLHDLQTETISFTPTKCSQL